MIALKFRCLRCGRCCENLIVEEPTGAHAGLVLFSDEVECFPANMISPHNGVGTSPDDPGFRIISYQLNKEPCPHIEKNGSVSGCGIYYNRPLVCKSYPFKLSPSDFTDYVPTHDFSCTAIKTSRSFQFSIPDQEWESGRQIVERVAALRTEKSWVYDLMSSKWLPINWASVKRKAARKLREGSRSFNTSDSGR